MSVSEPTFDTEKELRELVRKKRDSLAVVVGAGVSMSAAQSPVALWKGLLRSGISYCQSRQNLAASWAVDLNKRLAQTDADTLLDVAETLRKTFTDNGYLKDWLEKTVGSLERKRPEILQAVLDLAPVVVTTNYDGLLESHGGIDPVVVRSQDIDDIFNVLSGSKGVLHLHGYYQTPDSVVLGIEDYRRVGNDQVLRSLLAKLFIDRHVVLVGFGSGLNDPTFRKLVDWLPTVLSSSKRQHYQLVRREEVPNLPQHRLLNAHIVTVSYEGGHEAFPSFVGSLSKAHSAIIPSPPGGPQEHNGAKRWSALGRKDLIDVDCLMLVLKRGTHPFCAAFNRRCEQWLQYDISQFRVDGTHSRLLMEQLVRVLNHVIEYEDLFRDDRLVQLMVDPLGRQVVFNQRLKPYRKDRGRPALNRYILGELFPESIVRCSALSVLGEATANSTALEKYAFELEETLGFLVNVVLVELQELDHMAKGPEDNPLGDYDVVLGYSYKLAPYAGRQGILTIPELRHVANSIEPTAASAEDGPLWLFNMDETNLSPDLLSDVWRESSYYWGPEFSSVPVGFPFAASTMIVVYNRSVFDRFSRTYEREHPGQSLKAPATWDEFEQIANFFTNQRVQNAADIWGLVMQGKKDGRWLYYEWLNYAYGDGAGVTAKNYGWHRNHGSNVVLDRPETVRATERYLRLARTAYKDKDIGFENCGHEEQISAMLTDKVAMAIMWNDRLFGHFLKIADRFGFSVMPGQKSMSGAGTYFVNRKSPQTACACKLIAATMTQAAQRELMRLGLCSVFRSPYEDPQISKLPWIRAVKDSLDSGRASRMLEASWDAVAISEWIMDALLDLWRDPTLSVEQRLKEVAAKIRERTVAA